MTLREAFDKLRKLHNATLTYGSSMPKPADVSFFFEAITNVYEEGARRMPPLTQVQIDRVIENAGVRPEEFIVIKLDPSGFTIGAKVYFGISIRSNITLENSHQGFLQERDSVQVVGEKRYLVNTVTERRITLLAESI